MITNGRTTVGITPTLIDGTFNSNFRLVIHNTDNTSKLYIGDSNVTISTGFELDAHGMIQFEMNPSEELYAVSEKEGHIITWLKQV